MKLRPRKWYVVKTQGGVWFNGPYFTRESAENSVAELTSRSLGWRYEVMTSAEKDSYMKQRYLDSLEDQK